MKTELKPYDLVLVKRDAYSHIGQVISRPMEKTIMVRLVPDDPTTIVELPLSCLQRTLYKYKWVQYAEVRGSFCFPIDMLRYDKAAPVNFYIDDDGAMLKDECSEDKAFIIGRAVTRKSQEWTVARWSSFCWSLKELRTLKLEGKP